MSEGTWVSCEVAPEVEGVYQIRTAAKRLMGKEIYKNKQWHYASGNPSSNRATSCEWLQPTTDWIAVRDGKRPAGLAAGTMIAAIRRLTGESDWGGDPCPAGLLSWDIIQAYRLAPEKVNAAERASGGGDFTATASQEAPGHERLPVPAAPKCDCGGPYNGGPAHLFDCARHQRGTAGRVPDSTTSRTDAGQPVPHLTKRVCKAYSIAVGGSIGEPPEQGWYCQDCGDVSCETCCPKDAPHLTRRERQAATQAEIVALRRDVKRVIGKHNPVRKFGSRE